MQSLPTIPTKQYCYSRWVLLWRKSVFPLRSTLNNCVASQAEDYDLSACNELKRLFGQQSEL